MALRAKHHFVRSAVLRAISAVLRVEPCFLALPPPAPIHPTRELPPIDTDRTRVHKTGMAPESVRMQTPLFCDEARKQMELLRAEIRQDIAPLADYVAAHGDPAAELREMFDAEPTG